MDLFTVVKDAGALGLALYMVWAFITGKLHSDKELERERRRGDRLEDMLLSALKAGERSLKVAEHSVYEFDKEKREVDGAT